MSDPVDLDYYRQLKSGIEVVVPPAVPLKDGEGGGTFGEMDAWQQSVETRLQGLGEKLDRQLVWILGAFAAGFLALAGLMINRTDAGSDKLGTRIDNLSQHVSDLGERTARLEAKIQK